MGPRGYNECLVWKISCKFDYDPTNDQMMDNDRRMDNDRMMDNDPIASWYPRSLSIHFHKDPN